MARSIETIYVCKWCMFVSMSVVVTVLLEGGGSVGSLCRGCDRRCIFCFNCVARSCRCSCMGSMSGLLWSAY